MPPPASKPLTLIVATTPSLGIGRAGTLPWPPHKPDMSFFARVTKRIPATSSSTSPLTTVISSSEAPATKNAVIMGRKTWESIPPRFRPLKGRVNVIVSRSEPAEVVTTEDRAKGEDVVVVRGVEEAVRRLENAGSAEESRGRAGEGEQRLPPIGNVFVIGGKSIYEAALRMEESKHVLLTKLGGEWECDTFFPVDLEGEEGRKQGWSRSGKKDLEALVGENVEEGVQVAEGVVPWEFCLFSRK